MILITIDNNKDFMRVRLNRSRMQTGLRKSKKRSWFDSLFAVRKRF